MGGVCSCCDPKTDDFNLQERKPSLSPSHIHQVPYQHQVNQQHVINPQGYQVIVNHAQNQQNASHYHNHNQQYQGHAQGRTYGQQVSQQSNSQQQYNPIQEHESSLFVARYTYEARVDGAISIDEGEILEITDNSNSEWWFGRSKKTGLEGYVPSNYLAEQYSLESEPWYFGDIGRPEAIHYLNLRENEEGSFLLRKSDKDPTTPYSLSVRFNQSTKHYKIGFQQHDGTYFITPSQLHTFKTLHDLVNFYSTEGGLCCNLGNACHQPDKPTTSLSHHDEWEMDRNEVHLGKKLGSGQFGDVFEANLRGTRVAVKTLKPGTMDGKEFLAEACMMKKLRHQHLIQLYAVCTIEEPIYIITEFMCNGDLLNYLRKGAGKTQPENVLIQMSAQIADGMKMLESQNFIHRDLAARNILVGQNNVVKVADFGLARLIAEDEYEARTGAKFPVKWTAPEAATYCRFSIKSDVWSFGILLYEIITRGGMPYPGMSNREVMQQVEAGYRMPKHETCPQPLYDIMSDCWRKDAATRPTFETLKWKLSDYFTDQGVGYYTENEFAQMENPR